MTINKKGTEYLKDQSTSNKDLGKANIDYYFYKFRQNTCHYRNSRY